MKERYPDREPTPAETFEILATEVLELRDAVVAIAMGPEAYARVSEKRENRNMFHDIAPHTLSDEARSALLELLEGKTAEEILQSYGTDLDIDTAVKFETAIESMARSLLNGMMVRQDKRGVYLETERQFAAPLPGRVHTRFARYRSHQGHIVQENYAETGLLPPAGKELDEYRREKIIVERAEGWNGMPVAEEQTAHLNAQLATVKQQLALLKESGFINIREYLG